VADRLVEGQLLAALDGQGPVLAADGARAATVGARLLGGEGPGVLLQEGGEGALGQAGRGGRRELLHRREVEVGARLGVAQGATGDDFAPPGGQFPDFLELGRGERTLRHG